MKIKPFIVFGLNDVQDPDSPIIMDAMTLISIGMRNNMILIRVLTGYKNKHMTDDYYCFIPITARTNSHIYIFADNELIPAIIGKGGHNLMRMKIEHALRPTMRISVKDIKEFKEDRDVQ